MRKVKCDEAKPECRNCVGRGLICTHEVQLKWHAEFETRGVAFGRQGVWTKKPERKSRNPQPRSDLDNASVQWCCVPWIQPHHFLNTLYSDFEHRTDGEAQAITDIGDEVSVASLELVSLSPRSPLQTGLTPSPSSFPSIGGIDFSLLDYYLYKICPLTTASRSITSPFATLVLPMVSTPGQEDVLQSVLALAACHRSASGPHWTQTALKLKGSVLTSLRRRLASHYDLATFQQDPQILVIMMFLCLYEIVDKCDHRWVIHLKASQDIMQRARNSGTSLAARSSNELMSFTERFFAFQDVISRTACGNSALFDAEYWETTDCQFQVDSWMSCSPELAGIICRTTEIGREKMAGNISAELLTEHGNALQSRLNSIASRSMDREDEGLAFTAELKRMSVLLYMHCVLHDTSPTTPLVVDLVRRILHGVNTLLESGSLAGVAFSVFVAAVELDTADEELFTDSNTGEPVYGRRLVLEVLDAMSRHSLSNVSRTRAVIRKVWRLRDMHAESDSLQYSAQHYLSGAGQLNDWNFFVAPNSSNISLA
ncbi:Uu.00g128800.m01.CDS01 [Anthostomella pinea]|uniref:Uu.00g128800.m01.CDS01 n=1 Tax=Anthostomella pinea TaxID=933095 RepID=A0AAI8VJ42_9PEZI|nr:Uu.00g128800.m01.CDS01 [Anthostomella pinea]